MTSIAPLADAPLHVADVGADGGPHPRWSLANHVFILCADARESSSPTTSGEASRSSPRIVEISMALDAEPGRRTLFVTRKANCSSLLTPDLGAAAPFGRTGRLAVVEEREVETTTLDLAAANVRFPRLDAIKIDVQGGELEVLRGAQSLLPGGAPFDAPCLCVEAEVWFRPLYRGAPQFAEVDLFLREKGFELHDLRRAFAKRGPCEDDGLPRGQLVFGDALYFRRVDALEAMIAPEVRPAIAARLILLARLYGLFDFAQSAIDEMQGREWIPRNIAVKWNDEISAAIRTSQAIHDQTHPRSDRFLGNRVI